MDPEWNQSSRSLFIQPEFLEAKAKWEATLGKLEELTSHTTELVRAREVVYEQLVASSLSAYAASEEAAASSARYEEREVLYLCVLPYYIVGTYVPSLAASCW